MPLEKAYPEIKCWRCTRLPSD